MYLYVYIIVNCIYVVYMGNVFRMNVNEMLFNALKTDDVDAFKRVYCDNDINVNTFMSSSGRTLVHLCACYGSQQCLTYLLTQCGDNIDINVKDQQDGSTPLILASKYNQRDIIEILLNSSNNNNNNCDVGVTQCNDLNALDIAILRGNYNVAYYLKSTCSFRAVKPLTEYKEVYESMNFPLFDLEKFYDALMKDTPPELTGKFEVCRDIRKEFDGKVPDPNETWGQFFRRIGKMELYQPPLVEETTVDEETKGRLYMRIQGMLCEMEYGVKSK